MTLWVCDTVGVLYKREGTSLTYTFLKTEHPSRWCLVAPG